MRSWLRSWLTHAPWSHGGSVARASEPLARFASPVQEDSYEYIDSSQLNAWPPVASEYRTCTCPPARFAAKLAQVACGQGTIMKHAILLACTAVLAPAAARPDDAVYNLSAFETTGLRLWQEAFGVKGQPGNFSFQQRTNLPHPYSTSDAAHARCVCLMVWAAQSCGSGSAGRAAAWLVFSWLRAPVCTSWL